MRITTEAFPKISIVTITYDHENYIRETMSGVMMQQYPGPVEFIIANDDSLDNTDQIIKKYFQENLVTLKSFNITNFHTYK